LIAPRERCTDWRLYIPADFSEIESGQQVKRSLEMKVAAYFAELKPENRITYAVFDNGQVVFIGKLVRRSE
jgi:hypothetical protein